MWQQKPTVPYLGAILSAGCSIYWLQLRPYGVMFTLILTFWALKIKYPDMEISPPLTLRQQLETTCQRLKELKKERPIFYCATLSATLIILAVLGHVVSGASIIVFGLMLATIIFSRHKIIIQKKDSSVESIESITKLSIDADIDEFLPEANESNQFVLQNAGEKAVLLTSQPTNESIEDMEIPAELLITEPIQEIDEHTDSSDDECFLNGPAVAAIRNKSIEFKTSHFKQNTSSSSSSSDDDSITKGLSFRDYNLGEQQQKRSPIVSGSVTAGADNVDCNQYTGMIPNIVNNLVTWGAENILNNKLSTNSKYEAISDSSDDSEFELINHEELQH